MSYIGIYSEVIKSNNGVYKNCKNKCGPISIADSTGIDSQHYTELLIDMLSLKENEELDIDLKIDKLQQICDLLGFTINIHCGKFLGKGLIRIWSATQRVIKPNDLNSSYNIHIMWNGHHFEYIDWKLLECYPKYDELIYKITLKDNLNNAEDILVKYHAYNEIY